MAHAATPAIAALVEAGVPHEVVKFDHDPREPSFGVEAVHALTEGGVAPGQIYKTLIMAVPGGLAAAILAASARLSLKAAAAALGLARAGMADPASAQRDTGYVIGAISPFGQRKRLPTVIDAGALAWKSGVLQRGAPRLGRRGFTTGSGQADRRGHRRYSGLRPLRLRGRNGTARIRAGIRRGVTPARPAPARPAPARRAPALSPGSVPGTP